jgi:putative FmdB family regulatory protein
MFETGEVTAGRFGGDRLPIYEYECKKCGAVTDIRHGFKETVDQPCEACGGPLTRRFNPAGIVFKGSGFYVTDSRKPGSSSESGSASSSSDSKSSSSGESKSESSPKPAAPKPSDTAA